MKIAVFLDHDIIIRHFIHSEVFVDLAREHDLCFVFPEAGQRRVTIDPAAIELFGQPFERLPPHARRNFYWNTQLFVDYLRLRRGPIHAALRKKLRRQFGFKTSTLYSLLGLPGIFTVFSAWTKARIAQIPNEPLDRFLARFKPDLLIHPSILEGLYINELVDVSNRTGIPLVAIMNSWDNPSSKRAVVGTPNWLLVWGEQTWRHAVEFVGMPPERAVRFGAAQLDVFKAPVRIDRAEFCRRNGIDPSTSILLYAGSSKQTDEFAHVMELDAAIERGELGAVTVAYRPHPWGEGGKDGGRFLDHDWKHVRIESTMRSYLDAIARGDMSMSFPDYRDTHDVLSNVDAVISPLSTIVVEAAIHGKPVMCFLPHEELGAKHFQLVAHMPHFIDLFERPEIVVARSRHALVDSAKQLLARVKDPALPGQLKKMSEFFVAAFDKSYSRRLLEFAENVVSPSRSRSINKTPEVL